MKHLKWQSKKKAKKKKKKQTVSSAHMSFCVAVQHTLHHANTACTTVCSAMRQLRCTTTHQAGRSEAVNALSLLMQPELVDYRPLSEFRSPVACLGIPVCSSRYILPPRKRHGYLQCCLPGRAFRRLTARGQEVARCRQVDSRF